MAEKEGISPITVRMDTEHLDILKRERKKTGRSVNSLLRGIIRDYCENIKKESSLD